MPPWFLNVTSFVLRGDLTLAFKWKWRLPKETAQLLLPNICAHALVPSAPQSPRGWWYLCSAPLPHVVSRPSLHGHPFFILCLFPFSLSTGFFSLLSNCVLSWLSCDDFSASSSFALVLPSHPNSRKLFSEIFPRLPYLAFCLSPCLAFILTVHTLPTLVKDIRNFHCQTMSPHHCSLRRDSSGWLFHSCSFICLFVCLVIRAIQR